MTKRKDGKKTRRSVSMPTFVYEALHRHCEAEGVSVAGQVETWIRAHLNLGKCEPVSYEVAQRCARGPASRDALRREREAKDAAAFEAYHHANGSF